MNPLIIYIYIFFFFSIGFIFKSTLVYFPDRIYLIMVNFKFTELDLNVLNGFDKFNV